MKFFRINPFFKGKSRSIMNVEFVMSFLQKSHDVLVKVTNMINEKMIDFA
jgi:hypothetical protein